MYYRSPRLYLTSNIQLYVCYNTRTATEANGVIMASSSKRMSYTAGFKLRVIETAEQSGNRSTGREHNVSENLVWDWRKKKCGTQSVTENEKIAAG